MSNSPAFPPANETLPPLSSRLDKWTNCDEHAQGYPAYRAVVRDYGRGDVEATVTIERRRRKNPCSHQPLAPNAKSPAALEDHARRATARARTTIRRTVMAADLDHLLTLTYRHNEQDRPRVWRQFARFVRLLRAENGKPFPFVAVQEIQERGAIHVHAAVHGFQNVRMLRRLWHEVIGGSRHGNIDVQFFGHDRARLAKYLAKYISKDLSGAGGGAHRYKRSRGIKAPSEVLLLSRDVALDEALLNEFHTRGADIKFHKNNLDCEGPKWLWACSW